MTKNQYLVNNSPIKKALYYALLVLIILFPALYSRYPLAYSDTGSYVASSLELLAPRDRPLGYGIFIRIFSWKFTLWPVIFAQGIIAVFLLRKMSQRFLNNTGPLHHITLLLSVLLLALCTGLSWYTSQIMPDIFTSFGMIAFILFYWGEEESRFSLNDILYVIIIFIAASVHFSNLLLLLALLIFTAIKNRQNIKLRIFQLKLLSVFAIILLAYLGMSWANLSAHKQFKPSVSSNVFLFGRFAESGILEKYIKEDCAQHSEYQWLCSMENIPRNSTEFLWDGEGVMKKFDYNFVIADSALKNITTEILTDTKYLFPFLWDCAINSCKQLFQLNIGSGLYGYRENSGPYYAIYNNLWSEKNYFMNSEQSFAALNLSIFNFLNYLTILLSLIVIMFFYLTGRLTDFEVNVLFIVVSGIIINAIITASFANVYDRLQARVMWPFVFVAFLLILKYVLPFFSKKLNLSSNEA
jgi:hypothetical protein